MRTLPDLPFRLSDLDPSPRDAAPLPGQHNREIAAERGFAPADIDATARDGVLFCAS
jgi:crotonobetainyl-CoA:carnitine CoA-transferase CaiB-like acyl-CoA transferase